jgi:hypothetical protein
MDKKDLKLAKSGAQIAHLNMTRKTITVAGNDAINMTVTVAVITDFVAVEGPLLAAIFC